MSDNGEPDQVDQDWEALRVAVAGPGDWWETAQRLKHSLSDPPEPVAHALQRALEYRFVLDDAGGDEPYAPVMEAGDWTYPERLEDASSTTLEAWASAFNELGSTPMVAARLGDLLWLRRHGASPYRYAAAAHSAMCLLAGEGRLSDVEETDVLRRALDLARELNDPKRIAATAALMLPHASTAMETDDFRPGVALPLLDALARLPLDLRPEELERSLVRATEVYGHDPFIAEQVLDIRAALAPPGSDAARELGLAAVRVWESAADRDTGLIRLSHLQRAVERARLLGDGIELERLRVKAQESHAQDDLQLQTISVTAEIPREKVERFVGSFTAGDDVEAWLLRFALYMPISDDEQESEVEVRAAMKAHPLQYLVRKVVVNADNLPVVFVAGEEAHLRQAIVESESQSIAMWGLFAADVLASMQAKGPVTRAKLIAFLVSGGLIDPVVAEKLADCFEHYWSGRFDEASLLAMPRIEAVIRTAARNLGVRTYTEPGAPRTPVGKHAGLGELLAKLKDRLPEGQRRFLHRLLADPLSLNIRNRLLHGLSIETNAQEAALVLQAVCVLASWRHGVEDTNQGSNGSDQQSGEGPA